MSLRSLDDKALELVKRWWQRAFPPYVEHDEDAPGRWPATVPEQDATSHDTCTRCGSPGELTWAAMGGHDLWDGWACTLCPHRWAVRAVAA